MDAGERPAARAGQARAVARLLGRGAQDAGARAWATATVRDLAGIERCVVLTLPPVR